MKEFEFGQKVWTFNCNTIRPFVEGPFIYIKVHERPPKVSQTIHKCIDDNGCSKHISDSDISAQKSSAVSNCASKLVESLMKDKKDMDKKEKVLNEFLEKHRKEKEAE